MYVSTSDKLSERIDLVHKAQVSTGTTWSEFVTFAANYTAPAGAVKMIEGVAWRFVSYAVDVIAELPGWLPDDPTRIYAEHWGARTYPTQSAAEAGEDASQEFQAAINYLKANNLAGTVKARGDAYRIGTEVLIDVASCGIEGVGTLETIFVCTGTAGGFRFTRDNPIMKNLTVASGAARSALTYAAAGERCGVRIESEDVVATSLQRTRWVNFEQVKIIGHPSDGLVLVGAVTGVFNNCIFDGNKGDNVHCATEVFPRDNDNEVPGLCIFLAGISVNAGGHAISTHPREEVSSPAVRINVINMEIGGNATDAAVRKYPSEIYMRGSQITVQNCVFKPASGNTTIEGWYFSGVGGEFINNRYINCLRAGTISSHTTLQTNNVTVRGCHMLNSTGSRTYDPVVLVRTDGTNEPYNIEVTGWSGGILGSLVKTDATMGSAGPQVIAGYRAPEVPLPYMKKTDQILAQNSTTFVDVAELSMKNRPGETVIVDAVIVYMADALADLRFRLIGPSGSICFFNDPSSSKVGTSDTFTVQSNVDQTSQMLVGGGGVAVARMAQARGICINGATEGNLRIQAAQGSAHASDVTVMAGSHVIFYRIAN